MPSDVSGEFQSTNLDAFLPETGFGLPENNHEMDQDYFAGQEIIPQQ
jgi:hypothetical protein